MGTVVGVTYPEKPPKARRPKGEEGGGACGRRTSSTKASTAAR